MDPSWSAAQEVEEPSEEEYYLALEKGLAIDSKQEKNARIFAWWRRNDAFREIDPPPAGVPLARDFKRNLEALTSLLQDGAEHERVMLAEAFRELGDFEAALEVLNRVTSDELATVVRQIAALCDSRDACVRELDFGR
jgi:hypothetical protein